MVKKINNINNIKIYDILREMHGILKEEAFEKYQDMNEEEKNVIDAVHSVLYMAEYIFIKEDIIKNEKNI